VVNGTISAKGAAGGSNDRTGAGGSVWITTGKISGSGKIDVGSVNAYYGAGGGGAIAIEYTDATSTLPVMASATGTSSQNKLGGAGTIYVKGPSSTYGDLTVDNGGTSGQATVLPSLGSGTAQSGTAGSTLVTDRATIIPPYFAGNWVKISSSGGTVKGTWRIDAPVSGTSKTVTLKPNGTETISLAAGDTWQGVYLFDSKTVKGGASIVSTDTINIGSSAVPGAVVALGSPATDLQPSQTAVANNPLAPTIHAEPPAATFATLASIDLAETSVRSGATINGVVFLTAPAPPGGVLVTLSSSSELTHLPAAVAISGGATSAPFLVTASCSGPDSSKVTLTAVYGTTQTATLTITDCPTVETKGKQ
jgi:hypothetical protein